MPAGNSGPILMKPVESFFASKNLSPSERVLSIVCHCIRFVEYDEFELLIEYRSRRGKIQDLATDYADTSVIWCV